MGHVFLLDTQIVSYWADVRHSLHAPVAAAIARLGSDGSFLQTSAVVLGEIEYGLVSAAQKDAEKQAKLREFLDDHFPRVVDVTRNTREEYGRIKAALFERYPPGGKGKGHQVAQLQDPVDASFLGVNENDVWIAAQALERNLVLVSADRHMRRISELAPKLRIENWTVPPSAGPVSETAKAP